MWIRLAGWMDEQDAGGLRFSEFWRGAQHLNICEVESVLRGPFARMNAEKSARLPHLDRAYRHAFRFSKIRDVQALQQLRVALEDWEPPSSQGQTVVADMDRLAPFEVAQLVNLFPESPEIAKALLPSLDRFQNADINSILEFLGQFANLQPTSIANDFPSLPL